MPLAAERLEPQGHSPEYLRMSLAAAMTLGLVPGSFYRGARLGCINLLLTYPGGCKANCAFCGLAREKHSDQGEFDPSFEKFIRVAWRSWRLDEVLERCQVAPPWVERVCISMITHPRARADALTVCRRTVEKTGLPVSLLVAPTIMGEGDIQAMREAGADRIGVAIDAATPELFAKFRGKPAGGPHRWDHYWQTYEAFLDAFGAGQVGVHLIYGLGETERELVATIDRAHDLGGSTHLFCFFPEKFSALREVPQPPAAGYRRIQVARWLIDQGQARARDMVFDEAGRVRDFGVAAAALEAAVASGQPFLTSGCPGASGEVACNRPFGNEKPGPDLRNYPFPLDEHDLTLVRRQLADYR